ncbi:hypothetical protein CLU79DRAFT_727517 [Phycomyces nitens]|nr:hypothetical protein CLU79DRAFT_727517 [Phycomyces nitens]
MYISKSFIDYGLFILSHKECQFASVHKDVCRPNIQNPSYSHTLSSSLEGRHEANPDFPTKHSDYYVTVQLYGDNKPLTVPVQTSYKSFKNHWR